MIIALPIMQLFLFGYAINTNPQASADRLAVGRAFEIRAHHGRGAAQYRLLRHPTLASEAEAERALAQGECCSSSTFRPNFDRAVDRGEKPSILIDADATDPSAIGNATAALAADRDRARPRPAAGPADASTGSAAVPVRGPRPLQSRAIDRAQHRAGADLHRADDVDAVHDDAVDHPRARARHDGKPAGDAGAADRGDARQDRALCLHRLCPGAR